MNTKKRPIITSNKTHERTEPGLHWALSECVAVMAAAGPILIAPVALDTELPSFWSPEWQAALYMIDGLRRGFVERFRENAMHFDRYDADVIGVTYLGLHRSEGVVRFHPEIESSDLEAHYLVRLALLSDIHVTRPVREAIGGLDFRDVGECELELTEYRQRKGRAYLMPIKGAGIMTGPEMGR